MLTDVSIPILLLWFSLIATVLAMGCLVLDLFAPRRLADRVSGGCALLLAGIAVAVWLWGGSGASAVGVAGLSALCALAWSLRSPTVRPVLQLAATPRAFWGGVVCLGIVAAWYLPLRLNSDDPFPEEFLVPLQETPVAGIEARTDTGRSLPVFHYQSSDALDDVEKMALTDNRYQHQVIRLAAPTGDCNCHGWTFTGGRFAIRGQDVPLILDDNGYRQVSEPQPGDLALYTATSGEVTHTGVVRSIDPQSGLILIESKWGALGVYLHAPKVQPFGEQYAYYRSERPGHQIAIVPASSDSEAESSQSVLTSFPASMILGRVGSE